MRRYGRQLREYVVNMKEMCQHHGAYKFAASNQYESRSTTLNTRLLTVYAMKTYGPFAFEWWRVRVLFPLEVVLFLNARPFIFTASASERLTTPWTTIGRGRWP